MRNEVMRQPLTSGLRQWMSQGGRRRTAKARVLPGAGQPLAAGAELEEFVIDKVLGVGGFGVTYLARDTSLDVWRAVKEYLPQECGKRWDDGTVGPQSEQDAKEYQWGLTRFMEEAKILAKFDHRHLVRVYRAFPARGTAYLVMEYVPGRSLKAKIEADGLLGDVGARTLLLAITEGLVAVHAAGLLHRDIKPENVMLRPEGTPVLIDFGAARQVRHSRSVTAVVSAGYSPIEQYSGNRERQGAWTDIYALGAVAYMALSGIVPDEARVRRHDDRLLPVADAVNRPMHPGLAAAVDAALAVNEADRPQSLAEWRAMLDDPSHPPPLLPPTDDVVSHREPIGEPRGAEFWLVGRAPDCAVHLDDASVSRCHAEIVRLADGTLRVTDRGSTNGTFVLDNRGWRGIRQALLAPKDRVRFGDCEITGAELDALCLPRNERSSGDPGPDVDVGPPDDESFVSDSSDALDARKGLVRDPETGELRERQPPAGGGRRRS